MIFNFKTRLLYAFQLAIETFNPHAYSSHFHLQYVDFLKNGTEILNMIEIMTLKLSNF